ncbi:uncharacterized protein LOC121375085 [Gigantopelta aegis]|uniref:uncharacterized protein LOC121375085 n=1 Tax=Gigantopelta aegis TaxID=1735272 RepID=UPI001B88B6D4|nr:uncharacterized protein LOC121375085 [Gigantopelta aegis]
MAKEEVRQEKRSARLLPGWVVVWFFVTAIICIYDALFIFLRPHTLPGGKYGHFYYLYKYYIALDKRYQDLKDDYVFTVSLMNVFEVLVNVITIALHYGRHRAVVPLAYTVSVMTLWKTVHYFLMYFEFSGTTQYRAGNPLWDEFLLVVIPNVIWIILPAATMAVLWNQITPISEDAKKSKASKKTR